MIMFHFKRFSLEDDNSTMKVGTDNTILGAYVQAANAKHILDIGTGCGIIALMLAQKTNANIDALEIDHESCIQASENFSLSPWNARLKVIENDFVSFAAKTDKTYDLIISNPPYFKEGLRKIEKSKSRARHCDTLNFQELCSGVSKLLHQTGRFTVIIPQSRAIDIIESANHSKLWLNSIILIHSFSGEIPIRYIMTFRKKQQSLIRFSRLIIRNSKGQYTHQLKKIMNDYLLDAFLKNL